MPQAQVQGLQVLRSTVSQRFNPVYIKYIEKKMFRGVRGYFRPRNAYRVPRNAVRVDRVSRNRGIALAEKQELRL